MGVPALFRWLQNKYPRIVSKVREDQPETVNGIKIPVDITKPNPNEAEFDNLYLDMNGIIHPCCHPEDRPAPETEEDMMVDIFQYMERIINMVRPRKLLYLAIDGVAPRAKMNQQRSRRFRAAQEAKQKADDEEKVRKEWADAGETYHKKEAKTAFDSNCITPGTPFMANLATGLRYFIAQKLNSDPGWKNTKVILSDASVPGEGEHKIMDYIRRQRSNPEYDPNTSHVLYGLDADLIMLALATHEPHFRVLREDVMFNERSKNECFKCGQAGHMASDCPGLPLKPEVEEKKLDVAVKPYVFLHVNVLREYLEFELRREDLGFPFDLERVVDDWVFMCFFVGNDFLPHLPSLEIREGAIDSLVEIYKRNLPTMGGYLTDSGVVDLTRAQLIMTELGQLEERIFQQRRDREERQERSRKRRKLENDARNAHASFEAPSQVSQATPPKRHKGPERPAEMEPVAVSSITAKSSAAENRLLVSNRQDICLKNLSAAEKLRLELKGKMASPVTAQEESKDFAVTENGDEKGTTGIKSEDAKEESVVDDSTSHAIPTDESSNKLHPKRKLSEIEDEEKQEEEEVVEEIAAEIHVAPEVIKKSQVEEEEPEDEVKLWEPGFKERYYRSKFGVELSDHEFRRAIVGSYVEGLSWVLRYYYQGCPSWKWFYPYHFSPFASDFLDIGSLDIKFELGTPFKPFEQLMGVLPAASMDHIPPAFQTLMTDSESPIIDFYPEDFRVDLNGKKYAWQGVALLPWIEEARLLDSLDSYYPKLTEDEVLRNSLGAEVMYISEGNAAYEELCALYGKKRSAEPVPLNPELTGRLNGRVLPDPTCIPRSTYASPLQEKGLPDIVNDRSLSVLFLHPTVPEGHLFPTTLLRGVKLPPRVLGQDDAEHVRTGGSSRRGRGRGGYHGGGRDGGHSHMGPAGRMIRAGLGSSPGGGYGGYNQGGDGRQDYQRTPRNDYRNDYRNDDYSRGGGWSPSQGGGYYGAPTARTSESRYDQSYQNRTPYGDRYGSPHSNYGGSPGYYNNQYSQTPSPYGTPSPYNDRRATYNSPSQQGYGGYSSPAGYSAPSSGYGNQYGSYGAVGGFAQSPSQQPLPGQYGGGYGGYPGAAPAPPPASGTYPPPPGPTRPPGGNLGWSRNVRR